MAPIRGRVGKRRATAAMSPIRSRLRRKLEQRGRGSAATSGDSSARGGMEVINKNSVIDEPNPQLLDIYSVARTLSPDVEWIKYHTYWPVSALNDDNKTIEVFIPASMLEVIIISGIKIRIKFRIVGKNGAELTEADEKKVALNELGLYGMFTNETVSLNGVIIYDSNGMLIQQQKVQILLSKSVSKYKDELIMAGVVHMKPGHQDATTFGANDPTPHMRSMINGSKQHTLLGKWRSPLTATRDVLPTGVSLRMVWTRGSKEETLLIPTDADKDNYDLKWDSFQVDVPKARLVHDVGLAMEKMIQDHNATYKMVKYQSSFTTLAKGLQTTTLDSIYSGPSPLATIVTLIEPDRLKGVAKFNNVKYNDFNCKFMRVALNEELELRDGIRIEGTDVTQAVNAIYEAIGVHNDPHKSIRINVENWKLGNQLWMFNHTNHQEIKYDRYQELKRGNMRFEVEFEQGLPTATIVIFHHIFLEELKISGDRRIFF